MSLVIEWAADAPFIQAPTQGEMFTTSYSVVAESVGGTTASVTDKDCYVNRITSSNSRDVLTLTISPAGTPNNIVNQSPTVIDLDAAGQAVAKASGTATLLVNVNGQGTRIVSTNVQYGAPIVVDQVTGYVTGSAAAHILDTINARLVAVPAPTEAQFVRSSPQWTGSLESPGDTKNNSIWTGAFDFSCVGHSREIPSAGSSYVSWILPATLIADRFALIANHTGYVTGTRINFMKSDGSFVYSTIEDFRLIAEDLALIKLSSSIAGVTPAKVLPDNWKTYLPCADPAGNRKSLPAYFVGGRYRGDFNSSIGQYESHVRVAQIHQLSASNTADITFNLTGTIFENHAFNVWTGDSGGATILPINGNAVLVGIQYTGSWTGNSGGMSDVTKNKSSINAAMTSMAGTPYAMSEVDLSGFTSF